MHLPASCRWAEQLRTVTLAIQNLLKPSRTNQIYFWGSNAKRLGTHTHTLLMLSAQQSATECLEKMILAKITFERRAASICLATHALGACFVSPLRICTSDLPLCLVLFRVSAKAGEASSRQRSSNLCPMPSRNNKCLSKLTLRLPALP